MPIIKCKMCGGNMEIREGVSITECEYCGTKQTVPNVDNEKKVTLFSRANRLRLACEFDKAAGVYENLVAEFPEEAEAYWGLVLCKYGVEYVDDPATGKKIPTCHRSSYESILEDSDFEQACENSDVVARKVYREEAKVIERIRCDILEVSGKEKPYDIFICYKETNENGQRTLDSVLAQDVYDLLVEKGYRVFFSRITLEDKLGTQYEPYIFAALNSARVMLVFGTDYEYFNAVWVKNEWGRFLKLMASDKGKYLIPCYKNIDAYDMPKEFQKLQAQDLGKVGATQDLLRGIEKLLAGQKEEVHFETAVVQQSGGATLESLLERGWLFLEDQDWDNAVTYFGKVLDINPKCAEAYLGELCAECHCATQENLKDANMVLSDNPNYIKALRFVSPERKEQLEQWNREISERLKTERSEDIARLGRLRERAKKIRRYIAFNGERLAGLKNDGTVVTDIWPSLEKRPSCFVSGWSGITAIACRFACKDPWQADGVVGLKADGTVVATGDKQISQQKVGKMSNIKEIACSGFNIVGLKSDGTVEIVGDNAHGEFRVKDWYGIASIVCDNNEYGNHRIIGLKDDHTVVAVGENAYGACNVEKWSNIASVACGDNHTAGLKFDGTVVAVGNNLRGQCKVETWSAIVSIACGSTHTVGLKSDGTVVACGDNRNGRCDVESWSDIVAIACGGSSTVGLKSDGTVMAVGVYPSDVETWSDIVAISATEGNQAVIGLKSDGTVVAAPKTMNQYEWKLFENVDTVDEELEAFQKEFEEREARKKKERLAHLKSEKEQLLQQIPNLKGLFVGAKRKQIEARVTELEREISELS